jgi:putative peptidoglycan lipid II flippase
MIDRLNTWVTKETQSITLAGLLLGAASLAAKIVGIVRDNILASHYGATAADRTLDIYYTGFRIPDLLLNILILGAVSSAFLPVFTERFAKNREDAWRLASNILTLAAIGLVALAAVLFVLAPALMPLVAPGFTEAELTRATDVTRLLLISPILFGISSIISALLHTFKRFVLYSLAPVFYNIGIIAGTLFITTPQPELAPAMGAVFGALLHLLIQLPGLRGTGFRFRPILAPVHAAIKEIGILALPRTANLAVVQLQTIILTAIASTAVGAIAIFNLGTNLAFVPVGIFGVSFATAAFPVLAHAWAEQNREAFGHSLLRTIQEILFFTLPAAVLFLVLRAHIVRVVLGQGLFSWEDTRLTAAVLGAFAVGVVAFALLPLLVRAFFAQKNTKLPLLVAVGSTTGVAAIALWLTAALTPGGTWHAVLGGIFRVADLPDIRVLALPIAMSLIGILEVLVLLGLLRRSLQPGVLMRLWVSTIRLGVASAAAGAVTWASLRPLAEGVEQETGIGILLQGLIAGSIGGFVFLLIAAAFAFPEARRIVSFLRHRLPPLAVILPHEGEHIHLPQAEESERPV